MDTNPYLNIELKEDSAAKLASVDGQPTKFFLFAREFNAVVRRLNLLRGMIDLTQAQVDQLLASGTVRDLGAVAGEFVDHITALEDPIELGPGLTFVRFTQAAKTWVFVFKGEPGFYGTGQFEAMAADFDFLFNSDQVLPPAVPKTFVAWIEVPVFGGAITVDVVSNTLGYNPVVASPLGSYYDTGIPQTSKTIATVLQGGYEFNIQTQESYQFEPNSIYGTVGFYHTKQTVAGGNPSSEAFGRKLIKIEVYP